MFRKKIAIQTINRLKLLQLIRCLAVIDRVASDAQLPNKEPHQGLLTKQHLDDISRMDNAAFQHTAKPDDPPVCTQLRVLHETINESHKQSLKPAEVSSLPAFKKLRKTFMKDVQETSKSPIGYLFALQFIREIHTGFPSDRNNAAFIKSFESLQDSVKHLFETIKEIHQSLKTHQPK